MPDPPIEIFIPVLSECGVQAQSALTVDQVMSDVVAWALDPCFPLVRYGEVGILAPLAWDWDETLFGVLRPPAADLLGDVPAQSATFVWTGTMTTLVESQSVDVHEILRVGPRHIRSLWNRGQIARALFYLGRHLRRSGVVAMTFSGSVKMDFARIGYETDTRQTPFEQ